jgi:DNA-directed RNA polymerase specialized sigma24 family protein
MPDNKTVTHEGFYTLLGWLDVDVELAGEKYETIRGRLIKLFVCRGCHEAELLADRTIDRVIAKVPQIQAEYVGEPVLYFYGVANHIHQEWLRGQKKELDAMLIDLTADAAGDDGREDCLETCLEKLSDDARELILEYYRDEKRAKIDRRNSLAARLGISMGALHLKASRIRRRLGECVETCVRRKNV